MKGGKQGRLRGSSDALEKLAPPSCYERDPGAQDLSVRIFKKLDANSSGYLESPHELRCALEAMLGMYSALAKSAGNNIGKSQGCLHLADILSAMLKQFDFKNGRMNFFEWDVFARSMYEVAGRQRYWSIVSLWEERLVHQASHATVGNLMSNPGPEKSRFVVQIPHLLSQETRLRVIDAEVPENLPHLPPSRGRFQLTNTKSGSPRETAPVTSAVAALITQPVAVPGIPSSLNVIRDMGVDGAFPPSNGSPPNTACSSRPHTVAVLPSQVLRAFDELGVSPPRRSRRLWLRKEQDTAAFGGDDSPTLSACSSPSRNIFSKEFPKQARCVSIPGKMVQSVVRPATTPCQKQARMMVDWSSTWPLAQDAGSGSVAPLSDPLTPRKLQPIEPLLEPPIGLADSSRQWQHRWQAKDGAALLKRDGGMLAAVLKLRKSKSGFQHAIPHEEHKVALHPPMEEVENEPAPAHDGSHHFDMSQAIKRIQARVRGNQARTHVTVLKHRKQSQKRRTMLLEALRDGILKKSKQKGNKSGTTSPRPKSKVPSGATTPRRSLAASLQPEAKDKDKDTKHHSNVNAHEGMDVNLLQVHLRVAQFLKHNAMVTKRSKRKGAKDSEAKPSARREIPLITVDELWDVITALDGNISTHLDVADVLDIFHGCKTTGLDLMMAKFLPPETCDFVGSDVDPEDLSVGEVMHLCMLMIGQPEVEMTEAQLRDELNVVKYSCRAMDHKDVITTAVANGQWLNLVLFRRLIHYISVLMQIEQAYLLSHIYWQVSGNFEMTDTLVVMIMKHCARKRAKRTVDSNPLPALGSRHNSLESVGARESATTEDDADEEDLMLLLNENFSSNDFSKLCYTCLVVDPHDKVGLSIGKVRTLFSSTVRGMERAINKRVATRPKLHANWTSRKQEAANADAAALTATLTSQSQVAAGDEVPGIDEDLPMEDLPMSAVNTELLDDIAQINSAAEKGQPLLDADASGSSALERVTLKLQKAPYLVQELMSPKRTSTRNRLSMNPLGRSVTAGQLSPKANSRKVRLSTISRSLGLPGSSRHSAVAPRSSVKPNLGPAGGGGGIAATVCGRTEFSVLIQEAYKAMPSDIFISPLQMCVEFLQTATK